jgi:acyl-CoA thioesterase II
MDSPTLLDVLKLEQIEQDIYRANLTLDEDHSLYGGQVAAQALLAAGLTVDSGRPPHSLHGYFLRAGDSAIPTVFQVFRDRDGGSFSARRVVALQGGEVVFSMSASFQAPGAGPDVQVDDAPDAGAPEDAEPVTIPRLFSMEGRRPEQRYPAAHFPTRFWARATVELPDDDLTHACVLTYLSDIGTGLAALPQDEASPGPTLDHAVWFHRAARLDDWVLMDMQPRTVSGGRGWYTGTITTTAGVLAASFVQETLFRPGPNPFRRAR